MIRLTSLVGCDVDRGVLWRVRALVRHPVHSLYLKGVLSVSQQVADVDAAVGQSKLTGDKLHVVSAACAASSPAPAALTDDVVDHVISTSRLLWRTPLQLQRRLIHNRDDVLWG